MGFHVADLGQGHIGGPRLLGQLPDELADDAGAHHQHPVVEADPRLAHGVVGHHQGVDASGGHVGDGVRQPVGVGGLAHELLGIGPVAHEADVVGAVDLPAELLLAGLAHVALAAVEVGPEGHPVPHGEGAVPGVGDHAAELVAEDEAIGILLPPTFAGLPHVHVAAAHAAGGDSNGQLPRPHRGHGDGFHGDLLGPCEDSGLHGVGFHGNQTPFHSLGWPAPTHSQHPRVPGKVRRQGDHWKGCSSLATRDFVMV